ALPASRGLGRAVAFGVEHGRVDRDAARRLADRGATLLRDGAGEAARVARNVLHLDRDRLVLAEREEGVGAARALEAFVLGRALAVARHREERAERTGRRDG